LDRREAAGSGFKVAAGKVERAVERWMAWHNASDKQFGRLLLVTCSSPAAAACEVHCPHVRFDAKRNSRLSFAMPNLEYAADHQETHQPTKAFSTT
jgi:hypothetical protein